MPVSCKGTALNQLTARTVPNAEGVNSAGIHILLDLSHNGCCVCYFSISKQIKMSLQFWIDWLTQYVHYRCQYLSSSHGRIKVTNLIECKFHRGLGVILSAREELIVLSSKRNNIEL